jgi:hypothetical protein
MPQPSGQNCVNCQCFEPFPDPLPPGTQFPPGDGFCRLYPPALSQHGNNKPVPFWVGVYETDWCAQWRQAT